MKKLFYFLLAAIVLVACEPKDPTGGDGSIQSVQISKQVLELTEGGQQRLALEVTPAGAAYTAIWTSENEAIASVTNKGVVTAVSAGETKINVAVEGTDLKASCSVVVKSVLDATFFDYIILNKLSDPYDFSYTKQSGVDTTISVVRATFIMIPSTMYLDGDGYLVGEPGYCVNIETSFEVGIDPASKQINALYALADYQFVDETAINEKGQLFPYAIKMSQFNKDNYAEFFTQRILYYNEAIEEEPLIEDYPFYATDWDGYMLKGLATEQGIALLDGGYLTTAEGNEPGLIQMRATEENDIYPSYYNFDAVLFGTTNTDVYGFALRDSINPETGEVVGSYYMDSDANDVFDLAPFIDHTFEGGKYEDPNAEAPAADLTSSIENAKAIPAAIIKKRSDIVKAINVPFFMKVNLK